MSRWKKIEGKFKRKNKDITFDEMVTLLNHYGYERDEKGRTSGSRIRFTCENHADILMHKPHPQNTLKEYVINDLYELFKSEGFWNE